MRLPRAPAPPLFRPNKPAAALSQSRWLSGDNSGDAPTGRSLLPRELLPSSSSLLESGTWSLPLSPCRGLQAFPEPPDHSAGTSVLAECPLSFSVVLEVLSRFPCSVILPLARERLCLLLQLQRRPSRATLLPQTSRTQSS